MKIYRMEGPGELIEENTLSHALGLDINKKEVIAFVGAGGKTTSMFRLAEELVSYGKKVIVTTTTHMFLPEKFAVLEESGDKILGMLEDNLMAVVGIPCEHGKIKGVSSAFFHWMREQADFLLVEADGSKRLPLKIPNYMEPVIPENTDRVVILAGMSGLDKPLNEVCHRFELAESVLGIHSFDKVGTKEAASLIRYGYMERIDYPYHVIFNQCDDSMKRNRGIEIAKELGLKISILSSFLS